MSLTETFFPLYHPHSQWREEHPLCLPRLAPGENAVPIVAEASPRKRRAPALPLLAALASLVLLLGGAVAWSWFYPIALGTTVRRVFFGRFRGKSSMVKPAFVWEAENVPFQHPSKDGDEFYWIGWRWVK